MNIFILDDDIQKSAQYHNDKHVVKMILESAQILSTVLHLYGLPGPYRATHKNHPCVKWATQSFANWIYLYNLCEALNDEWQYRFNHTHDHKSWETIKQTYTKQRLNIAAFPWPTTHITPFAQAMPTQCKQNNAVAAYRKYYREEKQHLAKWTKRDKPEWFI